MADRPIYTPIFEEDESTIRDRMLANEVLDAWRKEPGDFVYDTIATNPPEIKQLQINQDIALKNAFPQYAEGDFLKKHLEARGMTIIAASPNKRSLDILADAGVTIAAGQILTAVITDPDGNPLEFKVDTTTVWATAITKTVPITCLSTGEATNLATGSQFILKPTVPGVRSITDLGTDTPGADQESDAAAWERYSFAITHQDTGGNKNDYIRWATEVTGVSKAKCVPLWAGNGTVKVILLGTDYGPASAGIVDEVQEYIDPSSLGLGEGKAPCGAVTTVVAATGVPITIVATITWAVGADHAASKADFEAKVTAYLKGLAFSDNPDVAYNYIGALLSFTAGIQNYSGLTVNGGAVNIAVDSTSVATLAGVTFS